MTRPRVRDDKMEAGKELDALVAEKVMGWTGIKHDHAAGGHIVFTTGTPEGRSRPSHHPVPSYSTAIMYAWQVVEKMGERGYWFDIHDTYTGTRAVAFMQKEDGEQLAGWIAGHANDVSVPLAICLAALMAVESESSGSPA
jgi:hypothetical protein